METAKQFMGFLMMATLLWLLYVLGKQLGIEGVIWTGAFLLCIGISCWLIGRFATLTATRTKSLATWAAALLIAVGGYVGFLEGVLDVRRVIAGAPPLSNFSGDSGIRWEPFALSSLETRLREGKPVFLDFTAEWCLTCKVNERTVLADREVVEKLRSRGLVTIRADWTNRNPDITRLLQKFGRSGVPLYVVFPAGRPTQPIVLPEVITSGIVIEAIDRALGPQ
jgi:thiol:disulfide interchange protein DsbD